MAHELMDAYQRDGVEAIREAIDMVVDTALSWDRSVDEVHEDRAILFRFGDYTVAVISAYSDRDNIPDRVDDVWEALEIATDAARERGRVEWLDEIVPLYRVEDKED